MEREVDESAEEFRWKPLTGFLLSSLSSNRRFQLPAEQQQRKRWSKDSSRANWVYEDRWKAGTQQEALSDQQELPQHPGGAAGPCPPAGVLVPLLNWRTWSSSLRLPCLRYLLMTFVKCVCVCVYVCERRRMTLSSFWNGSFGSAEAK